MIGPGKYDEECEIVRISTRGKAVIVIVINGDRGSGFSCQSTAETLPTLPDMLEFMAAQIRADLK